MAGRTREERDPFCSELERIPMRSKHLPSVMPALVPAIHVFLAARHSKQDVDGRDKRGHDVE
jgi:hypothetical protein